MAPTIGARVVPVGSKNLSRLSHTLGGSWTSRARILFDDPSRSAGSENEAQRKGYAVKFAKVERRTQGKGADYFQKWRTITQTGVLPRRRGCGLFPKLTDFFFWPRIRFGASISDDGQFHPVWDYIILYVKRVGVAVGPLGPPIVSGPRCQTGCCLRRRRFAQKRQKDPVGG